jgi:hypothetical protein
MWWQNLGRRDSPGDYMVQKLSTFNCSVTLLPQSRRQQIQVLNFLIPANQKYEWNSRTVQNSNYSCISVVSWLSEHTQKKTILKFSTMLQTMPDYLSWYHNYSKIMLELLTCLFTSVVNLLLYHICFFGSWDTSISTVTGYGPDGHDSASMDKRFFFLYSTVSRPVLGPTKDSV